MRREVCAVLVCVLRLHIAVVAIYLVGAFLGGDTLPWFVAFPMMIAGSSYAVNGFIARMKIE